MKNEAKHAVFLTKDFLKDHPHLDGWIRNGDTLDCVTVEQDQFYLRVKAVHQKMVSVGISVDILIPHRYITLVVFDPPKESKLGFHSSVSDEKVK